MTRKSKPRRACPMCKYYKYLGNGKDRRPHRDQRRMQDTPRAKGRYFGRESNDHRAA